MASDQRAGRQCAGLLPQLETVGFAMSGNCQKLAIVVSSAPAEHHPRPCAGSTDRHHSSNPPRIYHSADMVEGVRVGADAVIASEASSEDPSLDQFSTVLRSSRAQTGQQASTADTHQAADGVIFSKMDSGDRTLTQALHQLVFRAAKALQIVFWNKKQFVRAQFIARKAIVQVRRSMCGSCRLLPEGRFMCRLRSQSCQTVYSQVAPSSPRRVLCLQTIWSNRST